ncbi:stage III sporulation protein AA [Gorillibacterium timonense]|uniref:stage III sporulation protein AA n=1 Tax=Gorillibacterium timonense TaxID=1689269 RepID=UPI00071CAFE2|nr:stage III sporulation protein AA [Gorillibacterium timonense]
MTDSINDLLPPGVKSVMSKLPAEVTLRLEEIRIREGRPLEILYGGKHAFPDSLGRLFASPQNAYVPGREECSRLLDLLTRHSLYSYEEELRRGYITIAGGHRIGLAGRAILEGGKVKLLKDVTSFNIRYARQVKGCGVKVLPLLIDPDSSSIHHTLVLSPPQQGKTTLIRDLVRLLSEGTRELPGGRKVGVVDERSEIAACVRGVPTFDLGPRTDVLDGCPKAEGMMMMIRSMSPEILVVDEIGTAEDAEAVWEAMNAGIRVIATAHGRDLAEGSSRPALKRLLQEGIFTRLVQLTRQGERFETKVRELAGQRLRQARAPDEREARPC